MESIKPTINIPSSLKESQLQPMTEMLEVYNKNNKPYIGVPKESTLQEKRVSLVPSTVALLSAQGYKVVVEAGAGALANFSDIEYSEAGAEIAYDAKKVFSADVITKVAPPTLAELELFKTNQLLLSPLQLPVITPDYLLALKKKKTTALAMEYIQDESGMFPFVRVMSEIAGNSAILTAADLLTNTRGGSGILLGGIAGIPPAKIIILGAGVVGEYATKAALGLGADVRIFDNNVYKLMRLQNRVGRHLYTSILDPINIGKQLKDADVVIGAIHSKSGRTSVVINEEMVQTMKQGSVIIDVSIDQGGCLGTSELTTHDNPTFIKYGVIHYCVPNIASKVAQTASIAISNILMNILTKFEDPTGIEYLLLNQSGLQNGVYVYMGHLTNEYLGRRFGQKSTNLELLLTSRR